MLGRPKGVLQVPSLWQKSANSEDVCELLCAKATSGTSRQDKRLVRPDVLWAGSCWATLHRDPQVLPSPPDDAPFERADMARRPQRLLPLLAAAALSLALACTDQELAVTDAGARTEASLLHLARTFAGRPVSSLLTSSSWCQPTQRFNVSARSHVRE